MKVNNSVLAAQQRSLSSLIEQQRMPHAFVITEAADIHNRQLAHWLISVLACVHPFNEQGVLFACGQCKSCQLLNSQGHPDHLNILLSGNAIGVDQIRKVITFFEKTALLGKNQSVVVEAAEKMTESAANALLKTLEEPTANSHIILLATEIERLLPTIISRCRHIALRGNSNSPQIVINKNSDDVFASLTAESELPDSALFNEFTLLFYQFLAQPAQRSQVLAFMQEHIQSLNWCESLIVNIMRMNQRWLKISENTVLDQQVLARLQQLTHDDIWQLQLLNNACKKQIMTLTQANRAFQLEKLLAEMSHYLTQADKL